MDEIELLKEKKKKLRQALITGIIVLYILYKVILIFGYNGYNGLIEREEHENMVRTDFKRVFILGIILYIAIRIIIVKKYKRQFNFKQVSINEINREIPDKYSPAICSALFNKKVEAYKDYTATILYLEHKKYLKLDFSSNEYNIEEINNNIEDLEEHEKYVFECAIKKESFDEEIFREKVIRDMTRQQLIIKKKDRRKEVFFLIGISFIIAHFTESLLLYTLAPLALGAFFLITYSTSNKIRCKSTIIGKVLVEDMIKLKNFFREYTLLDDKNIEYKELAGEYLPYAISLGETKTIEKFLESNEKYRSIIYDSHNI